MRARISFEAYMSALISLMLLGGALYVILSGSYDQETQKWAFGIIGLIAGVWLRREHSEHAGPSMTAKPRKRSAKP
jgi:hypothetical protein